MVWNDELARLKQQLKEQGAESPPPPPRKVVPQALPVRPIQEEDDVFLAAMGTRPSGSMASPSGAPPSGPAPAGRPDPIQADDFQSAMSQLGGVKGLDPDLPRRVSLAAAAPPPGAGSPGGAPPSPGLLVRPAHLPADAEPEAETVDIPPPPPQGIRPRPGPLLIQLAAGMAIDVDASLDLRGHSVPDAKERLRERIADGLAVGWRTLHVNLGPSEALKQGLLAFLASPAAASVQRYAQAPVPMGGSQAWILYLGVPGA
jgi:hypothetical protein